MSAHIRVVMCWVAAIAISAVLFAVATRPLPFERPSFRQAPVAVIGTSLSRHGFPQSSHEPLGILGDGRAHTRMGISHGEPEEMEKLLAFAIEDGVEIVILELRPFLYVYHSERDAFQCRYAPCKIAPAFAQARSNFQTRYREFFALEDISFSGRIKASEHDTELDMPFRIEPDLSKFYPLVFLDEEPSARMKVLVERARRQGTRIILFLPPRAPTAARFIGERQILELQQRALAMSEALGIELFAPQASWQDQDFTDRAHLNRQGRAKLMADLREWWAHHK